MSFPAIGEAGRPKVKNMKIDIGESLVNSYLRHVMGCCIVQQNWKPSGNWLIGETEMGLARREFDRIQRHKAFTEIFKTGFEQTVTQTEVDVMGYTHDKTIYAVNITFHELGINFGSRTDTRNRVIKNLLRAYLSLICYFPGYRHVLVYCSPKVTGATEEVLQDYFRILENDFSSDEVTFKYLSNESFRDQVMMQTLDSAQDQFDTSELFLRSFKLLTVYASDLNEEEENRREESSFRETPASTKQAKPRPIKAKAAEESMMATPVRDSGGERYEESPAAPREADESQASLRTTPRKRIRIKTSLTEQQVPMTFNPPVAEITSPEDAGAPEPEPKVAEGGEEFLEEQEVTKVKSRVPKWFQKPGQNNSKILIRYMEMFEKDEKVSLRQLADSCGDVKNFAVNFAQMNKANGKNHGKVFQVEGDAVLLWPPVKEFIIQEYIEFKKSYYSGE